MSEEATTPDDPVVIRNKVALVGYTQSRSEAPWGDPEWDVIPCNNLSNQIPDLWPQATAWQNLHRWKDIAVDPEHVEWLKTAPFPVFMFQHAIDDAAKDGHVFPTAVAFPWQEIVDTFDGQLPAPRYFTNSIAWMIGFALCRILSADVVEGSEIALYGIDLAQRTEYQTERCCVEYWLGVAATAGVKITIPPTSDILKCAGMYGVDDGMADLTIKLFARRDELRAKNDEISAQWEALRSQMEMTRYQQFATQGALENTEYVLTNWLQQPGNVRRGGEDPYSTQAVEPKDVKA